MLSSTIHPIQFLILPIFLFISLIDGAVLTPYKCPIQTFSTPYPTPTHTLAVPSSNQTYYYSSVTGSSITLYPSTFPGSNNTDYYFDTIEFTQPTITSSPCFTLFNPIRNEIYFLSPSYGQYIDQQLNTIVIGTPNKIIGSNISFIDIITFTGSTNIPSIPVTSTIWSYQSEQLGLVVSLSAQADILAAYHDTNSIILFSPVVGRVQQEFNTINDNDVYIIVPFSFYTDTILIQETILLVTGTTVSTITSTATLLIYTLTGTLTSSVDLTRISGYSPLNIYATLSLPSSSLPIDVNDNRVVIGIPAWEAVYTCLLPSCAGTLTYLQNNPFQSSLTNLGLSVLLLGESLIIGSKEEIININYNTFIAYTTRTTVSNNSNGLNILTIAETMYPNRKQSRHYDSVRDYLSVEGNNQMIVGQVTSDPFATSAAQFNPFFNLPIKPIGFAYSHNSNDYFPCITGTYRDTPSFLPCSFCPVGTYTSSLGSSECLECDEDTYCPTGSSYPYSMEFIDESTEDLLPEFEVESLAESYEELLINTIFQPTTIPMIVCWVVVGLTIFALLLVLLPCNPIIRSYAGWFLALYRFAQVPEEQLEEEILEKKMKKIAHLEQEIHETQHKHKHKDEGTVVKINPIKSSPFTDTRSLQPPQNRYQPHQVGIEPPSPTPSNPHTFLLKRQSSSPRHGMDLNERENLPNVDTIHHPPPHSQSRRGSITEEEKRKAEEDIAKEGQEEVITKGFFNIVLALFAISAVSFSLVFLESYQVEGHDGSTKTNRFTSEELKSVSVTDSLLVEGLGAINAVNATINIYLIGYSGMECSYDGIVGLRMDGCIIIQSDLPCNNTETVTVTESEDIPFTCLVTFYLVQGTLLSNLAVMTLLLPSTTHMQAMRLEFIQDPQDTVPGVLGTGPTNFFETVTHPVNDTSGLLIENTINRLIFREWIFGIIAWTYQQDDATPPNFFYRWYNTVTSVTTQYFPLLSLADYNTDYNAPIQIILSMTTETVFRVQQTQKLIQVKAAFLTILLALIAIFHLVGFSKEVIELMLNISGRAKKYTLKRAELLKVAADKALAVINIQKDNLFNSTSNNKLSTNDNNNNNGEHIQLVRNSTSSNKYSYNNNQPLSNGITPAAARYEEHRPGSLITVTQHKNADIPNSIRQNHADEEERKEEFGAGNQSNHYSGNNMNYDIDRSERIRIAQESAIRSSVREEEDDSSPNIYHPPPFVPVTAANINSTIPTRASPRDLPPIRPTSRSGIRDSY